MKTQNLKNHSQIIPGFHYLTFSLLALVLIGSIRNVINSSHENRCWACLLVVFTIATFLIAFYARKFALKAQDRAIVVEQNFRYFVASGKPLDESLTKEQIFALRFAGNHEFVALVVKASKENMTGKEIKMAIQHWKGDYNRV